MTNTSSEALDRRKFKDELMRARVGSGNGGYGGANFRTTFRTETLPHPKCLISWWAAQGSNL